MPLADGRVLVAGGGTYRASAELYHPAAKTRTPTGSMSVGRVDATGALLRDGRVLVVGGLASDGSGVQASAELYNPATGTWTSTGQMVFPYTSAAGALLDNGQVLFAALAYFPEQGTP